jgi:hypothetical protein
MHLQREDDVPTSTQTLKQKAYHELKEFLLIAFYLWVVFGMFVLYKSVLLSEGHLSYMAHGLAIVNALAFGKVILIARALHFGERFEDAPLIYPTVFKSALFSILLAFCKILEGVVVGHFRGLSFQESMSDIGGGTWRSILTLTVLLFVMLIPFFGIGELERVLGEGQLTKLFFRSRVPVERSEERS